MLQMNCARGQMTVEAQWRGRAMKMELTGMYGFVLIKFHISSRFIEVKHYRNHFGVFGRGLNPQSCVF